MRQNHRITRFLAENLATRRSRHDELLILCARIGFNP